MKKITTPKITIPMIDMDGSYEMTFSRQASLPSRFTVEFSKPIKSFNFEPYIIQEVIDSLYADETAQGWYKDPNIKRRLKRKVA